jgi:hypothetical protein
MLSENPVDAHQKPRNAPQKRLDTRPLPRTTSSDDIGRLKVIQVRLCSVQPLMTERLLNDNDVDTLAPHLSSERVTKTVRMNALLDSGLHSEPPEHGSHVDIGHRPAAQRAKQPPAVESERFAALYPQLEHGESTVIEPDNTGFVALACLKSMSDTLSASASDTRRPAR